MDAHLMAQVASGDRDAIGYLYDRYGATLLPVALRILGNRADAEDVLHDAFVTLPERARHYSAERGSIAAWLIILVRNLSIDRTRRRGARQALTQNSASDVSDGHEERYALGNPEMAMDAASTRERVRRALASLPNVQRFTLQTAFFQGLSYPEISARDGVSLGTVKSRAARAIAALRVALAGEGLVDDDSDDER
jgi:RNA polymerase sigma-70 factor (ECF subfamily)